MPLNKETKPIQPNNIGAWAWAQHDEPIEWTDFFSDRLSNSVLCEEQCC